MLWYFLEWSELHDVILFLRRYINKSFAIYIILIAILYKASKHQIVGLEKFRSTFIPVHIPLKDFNERKMQIMVYL